MANLALEEINKIYSVSEISNLLKIVVENNFSNIALKAEVSGVTYHSSGHVYFTLKDQQAVIDAICWRGTASKLPVKLQEGLQIICKGRITTYAGRSKYQIIVDSVQLAGEGELLKLLEQTKQKLLAEGLFDASNKSSLPFMPRTVGVITSKTGAVIKDILHRISDRFPIRVILWPINVQGSSTVGEAISAIEGFNNISDLNKPDLLILARGGGSLEDLWAFNDENIVRSVAKSKIPIITAIGHETDTTLVDYAADYRAPTPTGAAEKAVPVRLDLLNCINSCKNRLATLSRNIIENAWQKNDNIANDLVKAIGRYFQHQEMIYQRFSLKSPIEIINRKIADFIRLHQTIARLRKNYFLLEVQNVDNYQKLLKNYSYTNTLARGFCLAKTVDDKLIISSQEISSNQTFKLDFVDSTIIAKALET